DLRGLRNNTRPPNSPIRFGVNTAHVSPQKTDWIAFQKLIRSIYRHRNLHFTASSSQLTNIRKVTTDRVIITASVSNPCIKRSNSSKFWWLLSLRYNTQATNSRIATLSAIPSIFFVLLLKPGYLACNVTNFYKANLTRSLHTALRIPIIR